MLSAKQATPRHGTQPSTGRRSNRTRAEGWRFGRRNRGHHPSKEGRRPRGATVGDTTFGRRPKACGPAGSGRRASSTMSSLVRQRVEVLFAPNGFGGTCEDPGQRPRAKPCEERRSGTSRTAAAAAKASCEARRRAAKRCLLSGFTGEGQADRG